MLVLSRRPGEQIIIDGNIVVTVVGIYRGKVRIGIAAPDKVPIMREEMFRKGIHRIIRKDAGTDLREEANDTIPECLDEPNAGLDDGDGVP